MTTAKHFLSLSILGTLALILAPAASAQGPFADLSEEKRQEIRSDLQACRENNDEHEDRRACAESVFEQHGVEKPERHGRRGHKKHQFLQNIPEEAREALKDCRENNVEHEDKKACAENVFERYGIEKPDFKRNGRRIGRRLRAQIEETCGERNDTDTWRECARDVRGNALETLREEHPRAANRLIRRHRFRNLSDEVKTDLRACRDAGTRDEIRTCLQSILDAANEED